MNRRGVFTQEIKIILNQQKALMLRIVGFAGEYLFFLDLIAGI